MNKLLLILFLLLSHSSLAGDLYLAAEETSSAEGSLRQRLEDEGHQRFLKMLDDTQLTDYLSKTNITLLIPSEEWFESLSEDRYQSLISNREAVREALHFHTVEGILTESELSQNPRANTLTQEPVIAEVDEEMGLIVNGLVVLRGDLFGPGFAIHVVDDFFVEIPQPDH